MSSYLDLHAGASDFFFSYDKIRLQLNRMRSNLDFELYANETPQNILARDLGDANFIGDLSSVEWRAFGLTKDNLKRFIIEINNREEGVRVLTYLRGHGRDVLPEESPLQDIEEFEKHCAFLINREIRKSVRDTLTDAQKQETRPDLKAISLELPLADDPRYSEENKIIFKHMWKQPYYQYTNCYPYQGICYAAQNILQIIQYQYNLMVKNGVANESYRMMMHSIDALIKLIKKKVSLYCKRYVLNASEPIIQTIFVSSSYLLAFCQPNSTQEAAFKVAVDELVGFVQLKYKINIMKSILAAVAELRQYQKSNHIIYQEVQSNDLPFIIKEEKENEPKIDIRKDREARIMKLIQVHKALKAQLGDSYTGKSQWFYVYKLMVEKGIYTNRKYRQFKADLEQAGISKNELPNTNTFTRKYNQLKKGTTFPDWENQNGGRDDILEEGKEIAQIAKTILAI